MSCSLHCNRHAHQQRQHHHCCTNISTASSLVAHFHPPLHTELFPKSLHQQERAISRCKLGHNWATTNIWAPNSSLKSFQEQHLLHVMTYQSPQPHQNSSTHQRSLWQTSLQYSSNDKFSCVWSRLPGLQKLLKTVFHSCDEPNTPKPILQTISNNNIIKQLPSMQTDPQTRQLVQVIYGSILAPKGSLRSFQQQTGATRDHVIPISTTSMKILHITNRISRLSFKTPPTTNIASSDPSYLDSRSFW